MIIRKNNLIVIENGHLSTYLLDEEMNLIVTPKEIMKILII
jgi:hypothetical protein